MNWRVSPTRSDRELCTATSIQRCRSASFKRETRAPCAGPPRRATHKIAPLRAGMQARTASKTLASCSASSSRFRGSSRHSRCIEQRNFDPPALGNTPGAKAPCAALARVAHWERSHAGRLSVCGACGQRHHPRRQRAQHHPTLACSTGSECRRANGSTDSRKPNGTSTRRSTMGGAMGHGSEGRTSGRHGSHSCTRGTPGNVSSAARPRDILRRRQAS